MSNPLLTDSPLPIFKTIKAEDITPAITQLIEENLKKIDDLLDKTKEITWENIIAPIEEWGDRLNKAWSPVSHLNSVANTPELRAAHHECIGKLSDYGLKIGQNERLYNAYLALKESKAFATYSKAQQKEITDAIRDFKLSGIWLSAEKRKEFVGLSQKSSKLQSQFQDNVLDSTDNWHYDTTNSNELAGLSPQTLEMAKQLAEKANVEGWRISLDYPCFHSVMTTSDNPTLRQKLHEAYSTRGSDQGPHQNKWDNTALMQEILQVRDAKAKLLGFNHYGELSLATKMAKKPEDVLAFLKDLASKAKPFAEKEMQELREFAKTTYGIDKLEPWDITYYSEKMKQARFTLSEEELRPYFPAEKAIAGLFEVVKRLYGLEIQQKQNDDVWHPSVQFYEIRDQTGEIRGMFYLDLYARAQKRGGAWMDEARVRRRLPNGEIQLPIAYLTCNFRGASKDSPALLTHDEVITLFHEFGHGLHHMLTRIDVAGVSGINGVPWDAIELPSQFMESWCWKNEALQFISGHFKTGEPLPTDLLNKMQEAKNFQAAMQLLRQLEFSLFDFRLHCEFNPELREQTQAILNEVRTQYSVVPIAPYNRFQNSFSHIFAGGYAAGYYSYLWAELLACDAFSKFEEDGIFNSTTGKSFLEKILEKGGSEEPEILFRDFRGRDPIIEPLLRHRGLTT